MIVHPYQSFDPVTHFLEEAARDPKVLAINYPLSRKSNSPIARALVRAAEAGKEVSVLVQLQARFTWCMDWSAIRRIVKRAS
jgi:polyphosphate kinase